VEFYVVFEMYIYLIDYIPPVDYIPGACRHQRGCHNLLRQLSSNILKRRGIRQRPMPSSLIRCENFSPFLYSPDMFSR
jgi:hypothetical protein